ncbi:MAG TPA: hypothetical protein VFH51_15595, partial [Myxococcota bacterium]|nr:hypothetical protein [Myxococcota bacterium]
MRPPTPRLPRSWLRATLALLLAGAFGLRVTAAPALLGCMRDGAGGGASEHTAHHGHGGGTPASTPPLCVCVAHGPGVSVVIEPARLLTAVATPFRPLQASL